MAGVAALLNQKAGSAQGELNSNLYRLAATPSNNVFHDVTPASSGVGSCALTTPSMCNNSTPGPSGLAGGLSGYAVGTGYDEATGLRFDQHCQSSRELERRRHDDHGHFQLEFFCVGSVSNAFRDRHNNRTNIANRHS